MTDRPPSSTGFAPPDGDAAPVPPPPTFAARARPGQLTTAWQIMVAATWAAVFFAFAATWKVSEEIGIGTWWLGPRALPQPLVVSLIPFGLALAMAFAAIYNVARVASISLVGSVGVALIAVFDISRSGGLAAIEFAIAAAAALVSLGARSGTYRTTPAPPANAACDAPDDAPGDRPAH